MGSSELNLKNAVSAEQAVELINDGLSKVVIDALTREDIDQIVLDTLGENAAIPNLPGDSTLFYNGEGEWTPLQVDTLKRGGVVGVNASSTTKPWFKMLELVDPNQDQNRNIVLLVHKINSTADCCGILTVNVKTGGSKQWVSGFCSWEYIGAGLDPQDFAYAYSLDSPTNVAVYCKCPGSWICYGFEVLYESIGATRNVIAFDLKDGRLIDGYETPAPNGESIIYSNAIRLQGTGGAAPYYLQVKADGHLYALYDDNYGQPNLELKPDGHLYAKFELEE